MYWHALSSTKLSLMPMASGVRSRMLLVQLLRTNLTRKADTPRDPAECGEGRHSAYDQDIPYNCGSSSLRAWLSFNDPDLTSGGQV